LIDAASKPAYERSRPVDQSNDKSGEGGWHGSPPAAGSIDQIRDIIFGSQMKEYERRFQVLEQHNLQRIEELHAEVGSRLDAIEAFARHEFDAYGERLQTEQSSRAEAIQALSSQIGDAARTLSSSIAAYAEKQTHETQDLRRQLTDLSQSLSEEIRKNHAESSQRLDQAVRELDHGKVARKALAELLSDMAARLSGEPATPKASGRGLPRNE
jgi:hypothetical protein